MFFFKAVTQVTGGDALIKPALLKPNERIWSGVLQTNIFSASYFSIWKLRMSPSDPKMHFDDERGNGGLSNPHLGNFFVPAVVGLAQVWSESRRVFQLGLLLRKIKLPPSYLFL